MKQVQRNTEAKNQPERRYDLDWLRVLAVLLLIYFHTAAIFYQGQLGEFYITNDTFSPEMQLFISFIHQWHMPLLFLLSGSATWFSLSFRTGKQYVKERFNRLFIPFIFSTLVIVPPQVYYRLLSTQNYQKSYLQFYPHFFEGIRPEGNFEWAHLWFIIYLFVFSLIALPFFSYLKKDRLKSLRLTLSTFIKQPGAIFLFAIPLATIEGALRPKYPGFQNLYNDWANFFLYLVYFVYGYLFCSDTRFKQAINRHFKLALVIAIATMFILLGLWTNNLLPEQGYSSKYIVYQIFRGFNTWCWIIAFLGFGQHYLNFNNRFLQYASLASYPFYILHQTVIVVIGFYVVQWNIGITEKFLVISTASLLVTVALYDLIIKRSHIMRFLFGMKPAKHR